MLRTTVDSDFSSNALKMTRHAQIRMQQRGIPPVIERYLEEFGEEEHDGHGGVQPYFSQKSIRTMERNLGVWMVKRMVGFLDVYMVESIHDGKVITLARRTKHFRRR